METLQIIWFALIGVLLAGFLVCGGFDFGIGMLLPFMRDRKSRDVAMTEIAPFWDGDQVWLITAAGALFAAFPKVYSSVLSHLYTPVILLLAFLIFRVVAIEFFLSLEGNKWRAFWMRICSVSSILAMLIFGLALGTMFGGEALLSVDGGFWKSFMRLFTPLTIASATLVVVFCMAQGSAFLCVKNPSDDGFARISSICTFALAVTYLCYIAVFLMYGRFFELPKMIPMAFLFAAYLPLSLGLRFSRRKRFKTVLFTTSIFALLTIAAHALAAYPFLTTPLGDSQGMSIFKASSSLATLQIMLGVALVGVPLTLIYYIYAHTVFSKPDSNSKY